MGKIRIDIILGLGLSVVSIHLCLYVITYVSVPVGIDSMLVILLGIHVFNLLQHVKGIIKTKRCERIDWFKRMGMFETACLIERICK